MPEIISEIGYKEYKHLKSSVQRVVIQSKSSFEIHQQRTIDDRQTECTVNYGNT